MILICIICTTILICEWIRFVVIYSGLRYSALGFLYVRIPGISSFQWHPFSTTSSFMQGTNEMSICIKPLGAWTKDVQKLIESANSSSKFQDPKAAAACPFGFQLFAEGPYGPQKDYFLRYISFPHRFKPRLAIADTFIVFSFSCVSHGIRP